jgi:hypothetical protein
MATTKKKPSPRSVDGASRVEKTGIYKKGPTGQKRYSSGAPARGTQARKDILADLNKLVKYVKTGKFKNYSEKKKVWSQIDNYRVALGTLKEDKRKSKTKATGVTTYDAGSIKVRKEAGFSRDSGRGGGRKSTQMADGGGKKTTTTREPKEPREPRTPYSREPWTERKKGGAAGDWVVTKSGRAELEKAGIRQNYKGPKSHAYGSAVNKKKYSGGR